MEEIICTYCKKLFLAKIYKKRKYCCKECRCKNTGVILSIKNGKREKSQYWKGESAGYSTKHKEIISKISRNKCSKCGILGKKTGKEPGKQKWSIQYANISGEYKREINDWIALCFNCHREFDKKEELFCIHCKITFKGRFFRNRKVCDKCKILQHKLRNKEWYKNKTRDTIKI